MSNDKNANQDDLESSSMRNYSEEDITSYSIKIVEYLCNRYKKAVETGQRTDFNVDEIWSQDLMAIIGGDMDDFLAILNKIRETTGFLEVEGRIVRLAEGKKSICKEVGIVLGKEEK